MNEWIYFEHLYNGNIGGTPLTYKEKIHTIHNKVFIQVWEGLGRFFSPFHLLWLFLMGSSVLLHSKVPQGPGRCQRTGPQRLRAAGVPSQCPVLRGPDGAGLQRHPEAGLWPGGRLPLPLLAHLHPDWRKRHHRHGEAHPVSVHRERAAQTHQDMKKREGFKFWRSVPGGQGVRGGVIEFLQSFWEQLPSLVGTKILLFFLRLV